MVGAHQWIAADLLILRASEGSLERVRALGVAATLVREWNTRVEDAGGHRARLAAVKEVEADQYPYYGELRLEGSGDARQVLRRGEVLISRQGADALGVQAGSKLILAGEEILIGGVLKGEPDRWAGPNFAGLRLMRQHTTGNGQNAAALDRILVRKPAGMDIESLRQLLEKAVPEALITDALGSTARINETLEWISPCLEILCWLGIGFAMLAMVAVAQMQKLEQEVTLRLMRSLGARPGTVERSFLFLVAALATPGVLLGMLLVPSLSALASGWIESFMGPLPVGEAIPWRMAVLAWILVIASGWLACRQPRLRPTRRMWGQGYIAETRLRMVLSTALGAGVALLTLAYFVDVTLAMQLVRSSPFQDPNLLLLKATEGDANALKQILSEDSTLVRRWRIIPFVRLASRNGKAGLWLVTCAEGLGKKIKVDSRLLRQMQLRPGEELRMGLEQGELRGVIEEEKGLSPMSRFWEGIVVDCGSFPYGNAFWNGGAWVEPSGIGLIEEKIAKASPGVLVVRMNEVEEIVDESGRSGVLLLHVGAGVAVSIALLLTGLLVKLASERRQREIAILRTLGATRNTIMKRIAREFARDAVLASLLGVVAGAGIAMSLMRYLTGELPSPPSLVACLSLVAGATLLATGLGLWCCRPFWKARPMEVLRRVSGV